MSEHDITQIRGLRPTDNPLAILGLADLEDQPAGEIQRRARYAMAECCQSWTPTGQARMDEIALAEYRRATHAYDLLHGDAVGVCNAVAHGDSLAELIDAMPYPAARELDWAALYARDLIIAAEEERDEHPFFTREMILVRQADCRVLGEATWGYRLAGLEPFELGEILPSLLALPEFASRQFPSDLSAFAIKWRWSKWESKGRITFASIKPVSRKERATWEAGPAPLFVITINGPAWLCMTEVERMAVLHHELGHAEVDMVEEDAPGFVDPVLSFKASTRGHDAEVIGLTWARFGPLTMQEAFLIQAAVATPRYQELLAEAAVAGVQDPYDLDRIKLLAEMGDVDDIDDDDDGSSPF